MADTYVITNFRRDDEVFWPAISASANTQSHLTFTCEKIFQDHGEPEDIDVTIEQITNTYGVLLCIGQCKYGSCRITEEFGTLYLSVA